MKHILLTAALFLMAVDLKAQTVTGISKSNEVFTNVDKPAEYPGGFEALIGFIRQTLVYPDSARTANIQGRVYVQYIVEKDGSLSDVKVIRGVRADIDAEAIRIMKLSPKWKPAVSSDVIVRSSYTFPMSFSLKQELYQAVEESAEYPGGIDKFYNYIMASLKYPEQAKKDKVEGKVMVSFVVDTDGSLADIAVANALSPETDAEALRLVKGSKKWKPAQQNGKPVRQKFSVPISFSVAGIQ